jgi:hypothetical protein
MLKLDDMARPLPHMRDTKTMRAQRRGAKDQRSSAPALKIITPAPKKRQFSETNHAPD